MNIHLPAIWCSPGIQGFDTLPLLLVTLESSKWSKGTKWPTGAQLPTETLQDLCCACLLYASRSSFASSYSFQFSEGIAMLLSPIMACQSTIWALQLDAVGICIIIPSCYRHIIILLSYYDHVIIMLSLYVRHLFQNSSVQLAHCPPLFATHAEEFPWPPENPQEQSRWNRVPPRWSPCLLQAFLERLILLWPHYQ